jgi:FtsZ-binding cell division protein ZapB
LEEEIKELKKKNETLGRELSELKVSHMQLRKKENASIVQLRGKFNKLKKKDKSLEKSFLVSKKKLLNLK